MKKVLLLTLLCFLIFSGISSAAEWVTLASNDYPPYVDSVTQKHGVLTEIVVAAFAEVGVGVKIKFRPWRRCALLVEQGEVFGAYPYGVTNKRKKYALFSDEIWQCRNMFFYLKGRYGDFDFTSLEEMQRFVVAGTSGNYYEEIFEEAGLRVDYAPGEASGVHKLMEMRTDMFAEDELVGWTLIGRLFPQKKFMFGMTETPWNVNPQHIMVSKKYPRAPRLMRRFNEGLKLIRENGQYDTIVAKYLDHP